MATKQSCKGALLVSGEPGTGKTRWIKEEAAFAKAKLFRWNARTDRSLREGREVLHQQVRSKERLFVWIEGADDLTQEAQAFLRRILETAAPNVTCALEVRELWKLSPPILSRCTLVTMRSEQSYRMSRNLTLATHIGITSSNKKRDTLPVWQDIPHLRKQGEDPYQILELILQRYGIETKGVYECVKAIGSGSSPWIQISKFLMNSARSI
ncbi:AAA family ATPase [bacterium]|nr:AAA family ATPase [bacterium]